MKPPAFQFYPDNFLGGTALFSCVEVGAYIRLLCYQWDLGFLPNDTAKLSDLARCGQNEINAITHKFALCPDGKLRNERMEIEREKQRLYRAGQSAKGKASAKARFNHGSTTVQPSGQPKAQPNSNSPSPSPSPSPISDLHSPEREPSQSSIVEAAPSLADFLKKTRSLGVPDQFAELKYHWKCEKGWNHKWEPFAQQVLIWYRSGPQNNQPAPKPRSVGIKETPMDKLLRENEEMFADGVHPDKWRAANPGKDYIKCKP